jgi:aryl-alcohol dehydrogenase-like predicted oxidoreductase
MSEGITRRTAILGTAAVVSLGAGGRDAGASLERTMNHRGHPRTQEPLPVIGLGTWQTFDVGTSNSERAPLRDVLQRFFEHGGRVIDSSPMYGRAEQVVGDLLRERKGPKPFVATKVWTSGKAEGIAQMESSLRKMGAIDLMQVHNLLDVATHLDTLRAWKREKRIRYLGITHYQRSSFEAMEKLMRSETLDFVQLPYSVGVREAEARLLPAALDTGTAVLVMRPFEEGALFARVKGRDLPAWAKDWECESWAQLFLKWIVGHPAVHCALPATSKAKHLDDNIRAGFGALPTEAQRKELVTALSQ